MYGSYTIPCCLNCNSDLGNIYEKPISNLLRKNYNEFNELLQNDMQIRDLIYTWLSIIFLKVYLKSKSFIIIQNDNKAYLSDFYPWEEMHHIFCISRKHYAQSYMSQEVIGTLFCLEAVENGDPFDFADSFDGKVIMIKVGKIYLFSVLMDASMCYNIFYDNLASIQKKYKKINILQAREIFSHLKYLSINLKYQPKFWTSIYKKEKHFIEVEEPLIINLKDPDHRISSPNINLIDCLKSLFEGKMDDKIIYNRNMKTMLNVKMAIELLKEDKLSFF